MAARVTAYIVACIVGLTVIAGLIAGAQRDDDGPVDLIVVNGRVYAADEAGTTAEAVAVQGNRILRLGTNREIQRLRRPQTVVVDAKGGTVLPGFIDTHAHLLSGGLGSSRIDLTEAPTLAAIEETIGAWAEAHPEQEWILGRGWYYEPFPGGLPTRQMLDAVVPDRPSYLVSYDGHTAWANTAALRTAGITRHTPDPAEGVIVKDARTGEPTGVLKEAAMALVAAHVPPPARDDKLAALRAAIGEAHRNGITSVHNAGGTPEELELFDALRREGQLDLRVYMALTAGPDLGAEDLDRLEDIRRRFPDDPFLKTGAIKLMLDGVVESFTAALIEPYATRPDETGRPRIDRETLHTLVEALDARGWQLFMHAIGDGAVRMALDALEHAARVNAAPERGRRHRIEHVETIDPADIPRFAEIGVTAAMQPYHAVPPTGGEDVWTRNLGPERAARGWAHWSLARAGARLVFGSDWPVMSFSPLLGLHVAVHRTTPDGEPEGGSVPGERLPLDRAIRAYTHDAAWASYDEQRKGVLAPAMLADIVILSTNILDEPAELATAEVAVTIFDGRVVYERAAPAAD